MRTAHQLTDLPLAGGACIARRRRSSTANVASLNRAPVSRQSGPNFSGFDRTNTESIPSNRGRNGSIARVALGPMEGGCQPLAG
jgi:hypothetical protein